MYHVLGKASDAVTFRLAAELCNYQTDNGSVCYHSAICPHRQEARHMLFTINGEYLVQRLRRLFDVRPGKINVKALDRPETPPIPQRNPFGVQYTARSDMSDSLPITETLRLFDVILIQA